MGLLYPFGYTDFGKSDGGGSREGQLRGVVRLRMAGLIQSLEMMVAPPGGVQR
jgi:hypothetical protein